MQPVSVEPITYKLAVGASLALGGSWVAYLLYLNFAQVSKQSVFMGPITFYTAVLLAVSGLALAIDVGAILRLTLLRHRLARKAALWACIALLVVAVVYPLARQITDAAT